MNPKRTLILVSVVVAALLAACGGEQSPGITVGTEAPEFTLPSARGESVSLSDYAGQPVLLYFHMAVG